MASVLSSGSAVLSKLEKRMDNTARAGAARSFLFVPGNRPERFDKAVGSGADAVILDLEDSVPQGEKAAARRAIVQAWTPTAASGIPVLVRVNASDSPGFAEDLEALGALTRLAAVMVPKAESPVNLAHLHGTLG